jgi:hypothetical protein
VFATQTASSWRLAQNAFNFSKELDTRLTPNIHGERSLATQMHRLLNAVSQGCFLIGGAFLFVGMHRFIFGVHPKLIWVRDLPWDRISYEWCFAAALGLALVGGWLGRAAAAHRARKAAVAASMSRPVSASLPTFSSPDAPFDDLQPHPVSAIVPPSA